VNKVSITRDYRSKIYFHCSHDLDLDSILEPRGYGINRAGDEPLVFRICVSPRISQCLSAVSFSSGRSIGVYACKTKAWTSFNVCDSKITGEKWILDETEFEKVLTIDGKFTNNFYFCCSYAKKRDVTINKRILKELYKEKNIKIEKNTLINSKRIVFFF
jgi:hypothetical protein